MNRILRMEKIDRYGRPAETGGGDAAFMSFTDAARDPASGKTSSRRPGSRSFRIRVTPEEGEPFTISARRAAALGLSEGMDLPLEVHEEILRILCSSCMQRCGTLLGSRDYSVHRLREKLQDAGFPPLVVEDCIAKLKEARYLDDGRYAQTYVRSYIHSRSCMRIRRDLLERGISEEEIDRAFAVIGEEADPEKAQLDQIRRLLQKRGFDPDQADYAMRQKTMAFLHRKGYETDLIRRAMEANSYSF